MRSISFVLLISIATRKTYHCYPSPLLTPNEREEFNKVKREYKNLKEENKELTEENIGLKEEKKKLLDRIKKLEKELQQHHLNRKAAELATPSSKQFPKSNRPPKGSRPRGAPKGHKGKSLKVPKEVNRTVVHSPEKCPDCGSEDLGKEGEGWTQTVWDIKRVPIIITAHVFKRRWCRRCKKKISKKTDETLPHRNYGPNITVFVAFLSEIGVTFRKIQLLIKTLWRHEISVPELMELANVVGDSLEPEYQELLKRLRAAAAANADETGFRVDGKNKWCWVFDWDTGILYVFHDSRGQSCPKEVLGKDFQGVLGRDGWSAYNVIKCEQQIDYVHVNRMFQKAEIKRGVSDRGFMKEEDVKFIKKGRPPDKLKELLGFLDEMRSIMRDAVNFCSEDPPPDDEFRFLMYEQLMDRFDALMSKSWTDADVLRLRKFLLEHRAHFFTFMIFPEISWENNSAERAVRKVATIRNNSGGRRSDRGTQTLQRILSVFETWKKAGKNVFDEALLVLRRSIKGKVTETVIA
jgi:transposase